MTESGGENKGDLMRKRVAEYFVKFKCKEGNAVGVKGFTGIISVYRWMKTMIEKQSLARTDGSYENSGRKNVRQ